MTVTITWNAAFPEDPYNVQLRSDFGQYVFDSGGSPGPGYASAMTNGQLTVLQGDVAGGANITGVRVDGVSDHAGGGTVTLTVCP